MRSGVVSTRTGKPAFSRRTKAGWLSQRKLLFKFFDKFLVTRLVPVVIIISVVVFIECLEKHYAPRVLVAKECNRFVCLILQVTETDDVSKCLDAVQDAVCTGECLDQPMLSQVLIYP